MVRIVHEALRDALGFRRQAGGREDFVGAVRVNLQQFTSRDARGDRGGQKGASGSSGAKIDVIARQATQLRLQFHEAAAWDDASDAAASDR